MIRFLRELRLVPIAVIASACLLALKTADLVLDRIAPATVDLAPLADVDTAITHAAPAVPRPSDPQRSWAQQMFNFPDANNAPPAGAEIALLPAIPPLADKANADIITGSVPEKNGSDDKGEAKPKSEAASATGKDGKPAGTDNQNAAPPNGTVVRVDGPPAPTGAERAILERLTERRQELDKRARELDIREGLIAEAEKRIEARLAEIKEDQAQLVTATEKKDEAEAARFKGLVTMYENMKARDAAKIFDRLEIGVLLEVASQINPRRMADILAQMAPETAERLTVEFANRAKAVTKNGSAELPKIEGRPTAQ